MLKIISDKLQKFSWNIVMEQVIKDIELLLWIIKMLSYILEDKISQKANWLKLRNHKDFSQKQLILLLLEVRLEDLLHSSGLTMLEKRLKLRMYMQFQIQEYSLILLNYHQANTHIVILSLISLNFPTQMQLIQLHNAAKLTPISFGDACSLNNFTNTLKFHYSQSNLYMTLGQ